MQSHRRAAAPAIACTRPRISSALQQVLFFRELSFPLAEITRIVTDSAFDVGAALRWQRQLLNDKVTRLRALIAAVGQL